MGAPGGKRPTRTALAVVLAVVAIGVAIAAIVAADGDGQSDGAGRDDGGRTLPPPGVACTEIACSSNAQVRLRALPDDAQGARVCVAGRCGPARPVDGPTPMATAPVPEAKRHGGLVVRVTLELTDAEGDTIRSASRHAEVVRVRPNGPRCPPVCFQVHLRYDGDANALTPAPPPF